jgi:hypothetical protein
VRFADAGPGAANRGVGTGTIVRFAMADGDGGGLGETEIAVVGVGVGVGGSVMTGDGVVLPHAARLAARTRPHTAASGPTAPPRSGRRPGITTRGLLWPDAIAGRRTAAA